MSNVKKKQVSNASIQCTNIQCKISQIITIRVQNTNVKYLKSQLSKYKFPMKDISNHNFFKFNEKLGKVNKGLKRQTPYLPNGDRLGKVFYTIAFRTLENRGLGHLQIPKKKSKFGQNAHVTQKPQIFYILQTQHL